MSLRLGAIRTAKQNVIGGLLVFIVLIAVSLALGFYGFYVERASRTTTKTPTTSPVTTPATTPTPTTTPANVTTTTPTNTTSEVPYVPE